MTTYYRAPRARKQHILTTDDHSRTNCGIIAGIGARYTGTETTSDRKVWPTCTACSIVARGYGVTR